ncbi:MAG: cytochrome P450 [Gemmatimonadaceae bacterium]
MAVSTESPGSTNPLPPGNLGLPWLGETIAIGTNNHKFYKTRFAKYGPIFKTRLFGMNFVVFGGAEGMHRFATDPAIERGGSDPAAVKAIFVKSLALIDGPEHRKRKAVMLQAVQHRDAIARYLPRMQALMSKMIDGWENRGRFVMLPDLKMLSAAFTGAMYTGDESEAHLRELHDCLGWMREAFMTLPLAIPGTKYGRAIKGRNRITQLVTDAIARHRTGSYDDILSAMLPAAAEAGIPDENLRGDLIHLIFANQAGFFVPNLLMTMTLAQHPEMMERAREEVLSIAPSGPITMDQMDRLEYLERLSKELRRYFAMNSATFFGMVKQPMEIAGYAIPQGWGAIGAIHVTMRSSSVFEDPERFDPDRFLPDRIAARRPGSYVPHGDGPRTGHKCPGEDIVAVAVKLHLTLMLRRYRWEIPPQDLTLTNEVFPLPKSGLEIQLQPHSARGGSLLRPAEGLARR